VKASADKEEARPAGRSARDFYWELFEQSQARAPLLAERERWLRSLNVDGREELLFEFELLLRGIERYFNLHNLPIGAQPPVITRDFREELLDVRDALHEVIRIARRLLDPGTDQKLQFRRYVESALADDRARRELLEEEVLDQSSPQESLFLLRQSFESLRTVIDHLVRLEVCSFQLFTEVGTLVLREIVLNQFFRPFRPLEFRIEYDRIKSAAVLIALRRLAPADRRLFTTALLSLFRLLHYLSYVSADANGPPVRRGRLVIALVRSELSALIAHLKNELAAKIGDPAHRSAALKAAKELAREAQKIARKTTSAAEDPKATFEAAVDYTQLLRRQVVQLARAIGVEPDGADPFLAIVHPLPNALRLRADLWVFADLSRWAERALKDASRPEEGTQAVTALVDFVHHFHDVAYQLLRYGDFEPFDHFCGLLLELPGPPPGPAARARLAEDCQKFAQVADATFAAVSRRSDLAGRKFDVQKAESILARFKPL
jgi:hypothetical protein